MKRSALILAGVLGAATYGLSPPAAAGHAHVDFRVVIGTPHVVYYPQVIYHPHVVYHPYYCPSGLEVHYHRHPHYVRHPHAHKIHPHRGYHVPVRHR